MMTAILNHLLSEDDESLAQLRRFEGKCVAVEIGKYFCWQITPTGKLIPTTQAADAVITVNLASLPLLLTDRMTFNRAVNIKGETQLGMLFAQLMSQLQWDMEETLSHFVGDVMAYRLMKRTKSWLTWPRLSLGSFFHSVVEYFQHETGDMVSKIELMQFYQQVDTLRADTDRLQKRTARLLTTVSMADGK